MNLKYGECECIYKICVVPVARFFLNILTNIRVIHKGGNFLISYRALAFKEYP